MSEILTRSDLRELTKYRLPSKQCAWLARHGIWFGTDRDGYPSTTWFHVNNPISLRDKSAPCDQTEPNFDAM